MALPTLESTWLHPVVNQQLVYTTEPDMTAQIFWRMTRALVACPNAVVRFSSSSSGSSATVDGVDRLTSFANVQARATVEAAVQSFIVVRLGGVGSTFDVCISHLGTAASNISISMSIGGNFVPAATNSHHPTAADRLYAPVTFGTVALANNTSNRRFHVSNTSDGKQIRFLVTTEATMAFNSLTDIGICDGSYTPSWTGPQAHITHYTSTTIAFGTTSIRSRFPIPFATAPSSQPLGTLSHGTSPMSTAALVLSTDNSNEWPVGPVWSWMVLAGTGQTPLICRFKDLFTTTTNLTDGVYFPDPGTKSFVVMGDMLLPWGGTALL